jgi:hypothetical protein
MNETATGRSAGGQYLAGQSGNPNGRPKGARNKLTLWFKDFLGEYDTDEMVAKAIELAKEGDVRMLKLCMDRLFPAGRHRMVSFAMPQIDSAEKMPHAIAALLTAVAEGELSPAEATELAKVVDTHLRAIEATNNEITRYTSVGIGF